MVRKPGLENKSYTDSLLFSGRDFSSGELFTGVASGSSVTFYIENPSGSGKTFFIDPQVVRSEAKSYVNKWFNPDSVSGGSSPSTGIINKNSSSDISSEANVLVNLSSFTGGSEQFSSNLVGANAGGIRAGGGVEGPANILKPGDSLLLEITNESAGNEDISLDVDWVEE